MKWFLVLVMVVLGSGCEVEVNYNRHALSPVSVEHLRLLTSKDLIKAMNESQFAGSAESSFEGAQPLLEEVGKMAQKAWPDGTYAWRPFNGKIEREEAGWIKFGRVDFYSVYKKQKGDVH